MSWYLQVRPLIDEGGAVINGISALTKETPHKTKNTIHQTNN